MWTHVANAESHLSLAVSHIRNHLRVPVSIRYALLQQKVNNAPIRPDHGLPPLGMEH